MIQNPIIFLKLQFFLALKKCFAAIKYHNTASSEIMSSGSGNITSHSSVHSLIQLTEIINLHSCDSQDIKETSTSMYNSSLSMIVCHFLLYVHGVRFIFRDYRYSGLVFGWSIKPVNVLNLQALIKVKIKTLNTQKGRKQKREKQTDDAKLDGT